MECRGLRRSIADIAAERIIVRRCHGKTLLPGPCIKNPCKNLLPLSHFALQLFKIAMPADLFSIAAAAGDVADVGYFQPSHRIVIARPRPPIIPGFLRPAVGIVESHLVLLLKRAQPSPKRTVLVSAETLILSSRTLRVKHFPYIRI